MRATTKPQQHSLLLPDSAGTGTSDMRLSTPQSLLLTSQSVAGRQFLLWLVGCWGYQELFKNNPSYALHDTGEVELLRSELSHLFGYDIGWQGFVDDLEAMRKAPLHFNLFEKDGGPKLKASGFISEFSVTNAAIRMTLPTIVREAIHNQRFFTMISWQQLRSYTDKWEQAIFRLCEVYSGIGRTKELTLDMWREYGFIDKPDPNTGELPYKMPADLVRYTITKPLAAMNAREDRALDIEMVATRRGNKIVSFHFKSTRRESAGGISPEELFAGAITPIPPSVKSKAIAKHKPEHIKLTIQRATDYIQDLKAKGEDVNEGAIYNTALSRNWGEEVERKIKEEEGVKKAAKAKRKAEVEKLSEERLAAERSDFIRIRTNELRNSLSNEELRIAAEAFFDELHGDQFTNDLFDVEERKFKNALTNVKFLGWMASNFKYEFNEQEFDTHLQKKLLG